MRLSLHDQENLGEKYVNEPELWIKTEQLVREALIEGNIPFEEIPGEAAFYGPKIEFVLRDAIGRNWQCGTVQVDIRRDDEDGIACELKAPSELIIGEYVPKQLIADTLSLRESEIVTTTHAPQMASVGLPFIFVELSSLSALQQAEISMPEFQKLLNRGFESFIHLYCRNIDGFDIRARMFAPMDGVLEDPATGSANCALIGLLSYHDPRADLNIKWTISQGTEIGRPSILHGRSEKINGHVTNTWIGGSSVLMSEGVLRL